MKILRKTIKRFAKKNIKKTFYTWMLHFNYLRKKISFSYNILLKTTKHPVNLIFNYLILSLRVYLLCETQKKEAVGWQGLFSAFYYFPNYC